MHTSFMRESGTDIKLARYRSKKRIKSLDIRLAKLLSTTCNGVSSKNTKLLRTEHNCNGKCKDTLIVILLK